MDWKSSGQIAGTTGQSRRIEAIQIKVERKQIVNNKNFNTTLINFIYQFRLEKDEILAHTILSKLMSYTNGIYKEEDVFTKEKLKRYIINYSCSKFCACKSKQIAKSLAIPIRPPANIVSNPSLDGIVASLFNVAKSVISPSTIPIFISKFG